MELFFSKMDIRLHHWFSATYILKNYPPPILHIMVICVQYKCF